MVLEPCLEALDEGVGMAEVHCKRCGSTAFVKSGFVRGHQRCRDCGCNFTDTPRRGKPAAMKALAVLL
jgi:transposase